MTLSQAMGQPPKKQSLMTVVSHYRGEQCHFQEAMATPRILTGLFLNQVCLLNPQFFSDSDIVF